MIVTSVLTMIGGCVSTVVQHFGTQFLFPGATGVGRPLEAGIANLTRAGKMRQLSQRAGQNRFISLAIMGRAEGAADGMIDKDRARWGDFAHDVEGGADHQCRNAVGFDDVGDETDGLVAKGSVGYEYSQVDLSFDEFIGNRWA
jgi:hypothetical protein